MPFADIDQAALTAAFGEHVLAALHKKELITDQDAAQILSQEHTGFSFWVGEPFHDVERALFVARYIERGPLSLEKFALDHDGVSYFAADGQVHEFDPLDFLALLSCHVPKPYEQSVTRFYGHYSCRARGERTEAAVAAAAQAEAPVPEPRKHACPAWAECLRRIYEIDPLECPKCKSPMRIAAFITDPVALKQILRSLGLRSSKGLSFWLTACEKARSQAAQSACYFCRRRFRDAGLSGERIPARGRRQHLFDDGARFPGGDRCMLSDAQHVRPGRRAPFARY